MSIFSYWFLRYPDNPEKDPYDIKTERYCIEEEKSGCIIESMAILSFCNEDLCNTNTGTLAFKLSYVLMGITVGFKVLLYFLVDMK